MREVVSLHFGQAGVQMGNATWELLSLEHGINEDGTLKEEPRNIECLETFYSISNKGLFVPRSIFIDLEPSVIDEVRKGSYRNLYHPNRLISGAEDAANNFARGFFTVGKMIISTVNNEFRKIMEGCGNVHGIMMFRGLGGGTGSGLMSAIFDNLAEYPKTYKLEIPIYPSATLCTSTVEPYNSLLAQHFCMEDMDIGLLFDNEAIFDVCSRNLKQKTITYSMLNRLIAQICSNLTVSIRFESTISSDLSVLQNNLVPYPRIHFPLCNYAPMSPESQNKHTSSVVNELTRAVFDTETQLLKVDHSFGKMMSCALNYRGDVSPYHVYRSLMEIKGNKLVEFVDWCPTGFKVGINICPPVIVPDSCLVKTRRNVTLLTNTSAIGQAWQRLTHKFYMLYSKKAFVHWFIGEGMEESEFTESLYNISTLVKDYEECVLDTKEFNKENNNELLKPKSPVTKKENLYSQNDNVIPADSVQFKDENNVEKEFKSKNNSENEIDNNEDSYEKIKIESQDYNKEQLEVEESETVEVKSNEMNSFNENNGRNDNNMNVKKENETDANNDNVYYNDSDYKKETTNDILNNDEIKEVNVENYEQFKLKIENNNNQYNADDVLLMENDNDEISDEKVDYYHQEEFDT